MLYLPPEEQTDIVMCDISPDNSIREAARGPEEPEPSSGMDDSPSDANGDASPSDASSGASPSRALRAEKYRARMRAAAAQHDGSPDRGSGLPRPHRSAASLQAPRIIPQGYASRGPARTPTSGEASFRLPASRPAPRLPDRQPPQFAEARRSRPAPLTPAPRIQPRPVDQYNWLRLLLIAFICVALLAGSVYFFFRNTDQGRLLLASWWRVSTSEAYAEFGKRRLSEGYVRDAVKALEIALSLDVRNDLSILLNLGEAYEADARDDMAELAYRRAIQLYPASSVAYRRVINQFEETGRGRESLALMELALEKTGDETFSAMLLASRPDYPRVSVIGGYFAEAFSLTLKTSDPTARIYYTLDGSDPYLGEEYADGIFLAERDSTYELRAVAIVDGKSSDIQRQSYTIRSASPDMPRTNLQPGTYPSVRTVSLRAGADVEAIYYTMDNTAASQSSKRYDGTPIVLRKGKTVLRAIAVGKSGKVSNEMTITYVCEGKVKNSLLEKDTFDSLELYKTTRAQFESRYGKPVSEQPGGTDASGAYTALYYGFGYALFLDAEDQSQAVLTELTTDDPKMAGPRGVRVGMSLSDALALFRDEGGEADINGNRVLYRLSTGNQAVLNKITDGVYEAHYYTKLDTDFIELALYSEGDVIVKLEWLRFRQQGA